MLVGDLIFFFSIGYCSRVLINQITKWKSIYAEGYIYSVHLNNTLIKINSKRTNIPEYSKLMWQIGVSGSKRNSIGKNFGKEKETIRWADGKMPAQSHMHDKSHIIRLCV